MVQEFREDLQFLRGIAIAGVLAFHIHPGVLPAGFLGVDVFFVLSGFLMCRLYGGPNAGTAKAFLFRRARRILPAYAVVLLATAAAVALRTLPHEFDEFARHALYSGALIPNVGFWMDNSYFEKDAFKPILHFWSLGVELQFYLIFPLIVWLHRRHWLGSAALAAGSLAACLLMTGLSPKTSFFLMPLRIWQFMFGFAAARFLASGQGAGAKQGKEWVGLACLGVILALMAVPLPEERHPGIHALLVTAATAGVLAFGLPRPILSNVAGRLLVVLGDYSYSIYLVHFPVILLWFYRPFQGSGFPSPGAVDTAAVLAITLVLSILLFHLVEKPARSIADPRRYGLLQAGLLAAAVAVVLLAPPLQRSMFDAREIAVVDAWADRGQYRCGKTARLLEPAAQSCDLTPQVRADARRYLLVGNSHADAIKDTMADMAARSGARLRLMKENCSLGKGSCAVASVEREVKEQRIGTVIVHGSPGSVSARQVQSLVDRGARQGFDVVLIDPVPTWPLHIPEAMYWATRHDRADGLPVQTALDYRTRNADYLGEAGTISGPNFRRYPVEGLFCTPDCAYAEPATGRPLYFDRGHLTLTGSRRLEPVFAKVFGQS